jgi:hypothetical protein
MKPGQAAESRPGFTLVHVRSVPTFPQPNDSATGLPNFATQCHTPLRDCRSALLQFRAWPISRGFVTFIGNGGCEVRKLQASIGHAIFNSADRHLRFSAAAYRMLGAHCEAEDWGARPV